MRAESVNEICCAVKRVDNPVKGFDFFFCAFFIPLFLTIDTFFSESLGDLDFLSYFCSVTRRTATSHGLLKSDIHRGKLKALFHMGTWKIHHWSKEQVWKLFFLLCIYTCTLLLYKVQLTYMPTGVSCFSFLLIKVFQDLHVRNGHEGSHLCVYMKVLESIF